MTLYLTSLLWLLYERRQYIASHNMDPVLSVRLAYQLSICYSLP